MKKSKIVRMISVAIALAMLLSLVPAVSAFADDYYVRPASGVVDLEPLYIPDDVDFFYVIDYGLESVMFGQTFSVWSRPRTDALGRPYLVDGKVVPDPELGPLHNVTRSQISFLFNRRADRLNPNRGNWTMTLWGEADISRNIRRGGYLGVRRRLPNATYELIAVIPIDARPNHRYIRNARRVIYMPSVLTDGAHIEREWLQNPLNQPDMWTGGQDTAPSTLEIRVGLDRRRPGNNNIIATERVEPGERVSIAHDYIPRGTRGTFRTAPNEAVNFVTIGGVERHIRDWIAMGETYAPDYGDLQELLDAGGNFGSQTVRFRIPNQPNPPAIPRMLVTPGRNGAPFFISRTNAHMRVLAYEVEGGGDPQPAWRQITPNMRVSDFIDLFEEQDLPICPVNPTNYSFEIRFFRNNRVVSAPGFLSWNRTDFVAATGVRANVGSVVNVTGAQNNSVTTNANPLNRNGFNVAVRTEGGTVQHATGARGTAAANVASWFRHADGAFTDADGYSTSLPPGLTAYLTSVRGANATINIHGVPEVAASNTPVLITIPASAIEGGRAAVPVYNPEVDGVRRARFNIAAAAVATSEIAPHDITSPGAVDIDFLYD